MKMKIQKEFIKIPPIVQTDKGMTNVKFQELSEFQNQLFDIRGKA